MDTNSSQKIQNSNVVYRYIYRCPRLSKQAIADGLNLSIPTVGAALKQLQDQELIRNDDSLESTGGRKARSVRYKQ